MLLRFITSRWEAASLKVSINVNVFGPMFSLYAVSSYFVAATSVSSLKQAQNMFLPLNYCPEKSFVKTSLVPSWVKSVRWPSVLPVFLKFYHWFAISEIQARFSTRNVTGIAQACYDHFALIVIFNLRNTASAFGFQIISCYYLYSVLIPFGRSLKLLLAFKKTLVAWQLICPWRLSLFIWLLKRIWN